MAPIILLLNLIIVLEIRVDVQRLGESDNTDQHRGTETKTLIFIVSNKILKCF